jgi:hypothetical protein
MVLIFRRWYLELPKLCKSSPSYSPLWKHSETTMIIKGELSRVQVMDISGTRYIYIYI